METDRTEALAAQVAELAAQVEELEALAQSDESYLPAAKQARVQHTMAQTEQVLLARLRALEERVRDVERAPAPRPAPMDSTDETYREVVMALIEAGSFDWPTDQEPKVYDWRVEEKLRTLIRVVQILARDVDTLRRALGEALESPGGRPSENY